MSSGPEKISNHSPDATGLRGGVEFGDGVTVPVLSARSDQRWVVLVIAVWAAADSPGWGSTRPQIVAAPELRVRPLLPRSNERVDEKSGEQNQTRYRQNTARDGPMQADDPRRYADHHGQHQPNTAPQAGARSFGNMLGPVGRPVSSRDGRGARFFERCGLAVRLFEYFFDFRLPARGRVSWRGWVGHVRFAHRSGTSYSILGDWATFVADAADDASASRLFSLLPSARAVCA